MITAPNDTVAVEQAFEALGAVPEQWDLFVLKHPCGTLYHSSAWLRVVCETYRYQPVFLVRREGETIQAGMPMALVDSWLTGKKLVAFPFSDSCEPLTPGPEASADLLQAAVKERDRTGAEFLEIRGVQPGTTGYEVQLYLNHRLSLDKSADELWDGLHHACVRRRIQKAKRVGIVCRTGNPGDPDDLAGFYRLQTLTRKRQGVPVQPLRFFKSLFSALGDSGRLELSFACDGGRRVAAILVIDFGDVAYYKFGACENRSNWTGANQALMWRAIRNAQIRGARVFDFGRTSVENHGLLDYKRRWGTTERPLHYLVSPPGNRPQSLVETSGLHKLLKALFRIAPVWANRLTGKYLYRHLG